MIALLSRRFAPPPILPVGDDFLAGLHQADGLALDGGSLHDDLKAGEGVGHDDVNGGDEGGRDKTRHELGLR